MDDDGSQREYSDERLVAGRLLVAAQFALLVWLVLPLTPFVPSAAALLLLGSSVVLGLWTLAHNRPGNFNIHPEPKASGRLVTSGPYRFLRHPMYASLLLFAGAAVVAYWDLWKAAGWIVLAVVLWGKAALEERGLARHYPDYAAYARRTRRFIPGLF